MNYFLKIINTFLIFICFTTFTYAQQDTISANIYLKKADSLINKYQCAPSVDYTQKALAIYQKINHWEKIAKCHNLLSENYSYLEKGDLSLLHANKALAILQTYLPNHIERYSTYLNLAFYYDEVLYDYPTALDYFDKALEVVKNDPEKNALKIASLYNNMGITCRNMASYEKSSNYFRSSLKMYLSHKDTEPISIAYVYANIGLTYQLQGEYSKALDLQEKSLEIKKKVLGKDHHQVAYQYHDIGILLKRMGQYDKALLSFNKTLDILSEKSEQYVPVISNSIGTLYKEMGEYDKAISYYNKAIHYMIKKDGGMKDKPDYATFYNNIGYAYFKKKQIDNAIKNCTKSLDILHKIFTDTSHPSYAYTYKNLSKIALQQQNYTLALEYQHKVREIFTSHMNERLIDFIEAHNDLALIYLKMKDFKTASKHFHIALEHNKAVQTTSFSPTLYFNPNQLLISLEGMADIKYQQYITTKNASLLEESNLYHQQVGDLITDCRQLLTSYKDKIVFSKRVKSIYTKSILSSLQNPHDNSAIHNAFYISEKSKYNTLRELLSISNAKQFLELPETITSAEEHYKKKYAEYTSKIEKLDSKKKEDSLQIMSLESSLLDITKIQDSLTTVIEKKYPQYHQLKYNTTTSSIEEIQQRLDSRTTLLEYFTNDSILYAFTINKKQVYAQQLNISSLKEQIAQLQHAISNKEHTTYISLAHSLYTQLIAPIKNQLTGDQLIIIPDEYLWHVPFELLLTMVPESNNQKDFPYLLEEYAISYANAASMLFTNSTKKTTPDIKQECLAFSFSDTTSISENPTTIKLATLRDSGDDLPGTRKEIKAISNIIGGNYFYGKDANEKNFKKNANTYAILHLALHGEVDNNNPENSRLLFTKNKDSIEDNILYSHELFAMNIPSKLTVLSACNTGTGKIAKGEGVMSLGNAFQYAGTKSLLLSYWEVSDKASPFIMQQFYKNLSSGMNKAKALQKAKLAYLKTSDIHSIHPFYWGGFYLVGDSTPIPFDHPINTWYLLATVLLLGLAGLYIYRRKKNS
ncbi:CHAT domain-containing protein [Aquimarina sp. TRL1]|uniref:CHAT domain-containing protein n=1 Tax=Aquimarina sp. (strain TRL1) TaxID=2736252 RepID=UPI00158D7AE6|nr:CHAT domain-containing tetratricopeptide repeat protein [Aquimarina sp. TRL1]QKX06991.1 CHAT domain-containing protein [Aquimarina sp. TRL1]